MKAMNGVIFRKENTILIRNLTYFCRDLGGIEYVCFLRWILHFMLRSEAGSSLFHRVGEVQFKIRFGSKTLCEINSL